MTAEDRIWAKNTETKKQAVLQKSVAYNFHGSHTGQLDC